MDELDFLEASMQRKINFENYLKTLPINHPINYFWDVPITFNDFWITEFISMESGPIAGIIRFCDAYSIESDIETPRNNGIPEILKNRQQWVWLEPDKYKFGQYKPYLCRGITEENELSAENWIPYFPDTKSNLADGIGYVLNNDEITENLRLVAIHISPSSTLNHKQVNNLWLALGRPYFEYSRFNNGWTMLGLVNRALPTYNSDGIKIFTSGDFVELSGLGCKGHLKDITDEILSLHAYRFPKEKSIGVSNSPPFTPAAKARLEDMLNHISADCNRSIYMRVIWGILSTGWPTAKQIALNWSLTAPHRFEQEAFDNLVNSYDPLRNDSITLGTIYHLAKNGGWRG